jgi:6-pyruvoyltetrahydropterin/6-carboxytetrahydropterin synthase
MEQEIVNIELVKSMTFQAAHELPKVPEDHKCRRMHGHSYKVEVAVRGPVDPDTGWLMDFGDINLRLRPIREELDHRVLNDVEGLENPTAENLAAWIWKRLSVNLPDLTRVSVFESESSGCHYYGD